MTSHSILCKEERRQVADIRTLPTPKDLLVELAGARRGALDDPIGGPAATLSPTPLGLVGERRLELMRGGGVTYSLCRFLLWSRRGVLVGLPADAPRLCAPTQLCKH